MRATALMAILWLTCAAPVFAAGDAEDDALDLADATPESVKAVAGDWRVFMELSAGQVSLRQGGAASTTADTQRLSLDVLLDKQISPTLRGVFSDRLDQSRQSEAPGSSVQTLNTFKEAYLSWQPQNDRVLGGGRINVRYGTAVGYNPTDYFREGANRSIVSVDPNSIRENRMGTVMLQGQTLWQGGSLTAIYAPKVADAPDDGDWSADFGSTNNRRRWLLAVSHQLADNLNPQMVLYGDQRQPVQLGLNLAALINDAMLAHLEWSGGRAKSLLAQALPWAPGVAQDEVFRNRLAAGLTYTSASKMSVALEYHYNGAAVDEAQWSALRSDSLLNYGSYRQVVQEQLELTTRHAAFVRATWQDALVNKLDLAAMLRFNLDDSSHLAWLEARYRLNRAEVALQWQLASGDALSDFGALAQRRNIQALFRYYF
ncbi:MAG: hypothetical protein ACOYNF_04040 [Rhodoferax sp.]